MSNKTIKMAECNEVFKDAEEHICTNHENPHDDEYDDDTVDEAQDEYDDDDDDDQERVDPTIEEEKSRLIGEKNNNEGCVEELKTSTKRALLEFRCRLEDAILGNSLFGKFNGKESVKQREDLRNVTLWGVPLLPSKGHQGTDIILLKFLTARDFKALDAFEMLRKTLIWRKEFKTDGILDENFGDIHHDELEKMFFIDGGATDKEGHPLHYNKVYGAFKDKELYKKTFGTEKGRDEFVRWRVRCMEKGIKALNFSGDGGGGVVESIVQITDLKNSPGSVMKDMRLVSRKALLLLQDNYPGLIDRYIVINVPFWHYAYRMILLHLLSQKTKNKFVFARPSRVTETLLKYITPENIPIQYGGLKRDNDDDFLPSDKTSELIIKKGLKNSIKILIAEGGMTAVWDVTAVGMEVTYKEEFIADDEGSYNILLHKEKQMRESVRNSFYISEPGKLVITITNGTFKKKRVFYRFKLKQTLPIYTFLK